MIAPQQSLVGFRTYLLLLSFSFRLLHYAGNAECTERKCKPTDCNSEYKCIASGPFDCFDGYVGRPYDNMGPFYRGYTCLLSEYDGPLVDFKTAVPCLLETIDPSNDSKCMGWYNNCWSVTEDGSRLYNLPVLKAEPMGCSNGYEVHLVAQYSLYTCCTANHTGPVEYDIPPYKGVTENTFKIINGVLAFATAATSILGLICIILILLNSTTRKNGYNIFNVFLLAPDVLLNVGLFLLAQSQTKGFRPELQFQSKGFFKILYGVIIFIVMSLFWLNAIVVYYVHDMLLRGHQRRRSKSPSVSKVVILSCSVYAVVAPYVAWLFQSTWSPLNDEASGRLVRSLFIYIPWFCPIIYVIYTKVSIKMRRLLPESGTTRGLALHFDKIFILFVFSYLPCIIINEFFNEFFVLRILNNFLLQLGALASIAIVCSKPDIKRCIVKTRNQFSVKIQNQFSVLKKQDTIGMQSQGTGYLKKQDNNGLQLQGPGDNSLETSVAGRLAQKVDMPSVNNHATSAVNKAKEFAVPIQQEEQNSKEDDKEEINKW